MIRKFFLLAHAVAVLVCHLNAQTFRPHGVKIDLAGAFQERLGLAYEWRATEKSSFQIAFNYSDENPTSIDFFNGAMITNYAWREVVKTAPFQGSVLESADYLGTGRPLPELAAPVVPLSIAQGSVSYRASYNEGNWRFFLQPSLILAQHRFAETNERTAIVEKDIEQWQIGTFADGKITQYTTHYRQTREMQVRQCWFGGVAYDIGLSNTLKCGLHFEAGVGLGLNVGKYAYESPETPYKLNKIYPRYALLVGYFLGKIKEAVPLNNP